MVAVSEGFALGTKLGMDANKLQEVFSGASSKCWCTDIGTPVPGVTPTSSASNGYQGGFGSALLRKDLDMALDFADQFGVKTEFG